MSNAIREALEAAVAALSPTIVTAWEGRAFNPATDVPEGEPYQEVHLRLDDPGNDEFGQAALVEGFLQITLAYPFGKGTGPAEARAAQIIAAFPRGRTLTASGQKVSITRTPAMRAGYRDADRWRVPVFVRFHAWT